MTPQHHDRDMYPDTRHGIPMRRWLCTEPGCPAVISDDTLYGIQLPGATITVPAAAAGPGTTGGPA